MKRDMRRYRDQVLSRAWLLWATGRLLSGRYVEALFWAGLVRLQDVDTVSSYGKRGLRWSMNMDRDYCPECDQYVVASVLDEYGCCLGCVELAQQEARNEAHYDEAACPECGWIDGHMEPCSLGTGRVEDDQMWPGMD